MQSWSSCLWNLSLSLFYTETLTLSLERFTQHRLYFQVSWILFNLKYTAEKQLKLCINIQLVRSILKLKEVRYFKQRTLLQIKTQLKWGFFFLLNISICLNFFSCPVKVTLGFISYYLLSIRHLMDVSNVYVQVSIRTFTDGHDG